MANDYFSSFTALVAHTIARSEILTAIFNSVVAGFDKMPSLKRLLEGRVTYAVDSGAMNAYVLTLEKAPSEYNDGLKIAFIPGNTNSTDSTVNVYNASGVLLGVKAIKRFDGNGLLPGDLPSTTICEMIYNAARGSFQLQSPITTAAAVTVTYGVKSISTDTTPNPLNQKISVLGAMKSRVTAAAGDARFQLKLGMETEVSVTGGTLVVGSLTPITSAGGVLALNMPGAGAGDTTLQDGDIVGLVDVGGAIETNNVTLTGNAGNLVFMGQAPAATLVWNGPNFSTLIFRWKAATSQWIGNGMD